MKILKYRTRKVVLILEALNVISISVQNYISSGLFCKQNFIWKHTWCSFVFLFTSKVC